MNDDIQQGHPAGGHMSERNFEKLACFISQYSGIKMPPNKLTMLEGRLRRRLRATNIGSFDEYCHFLFNERGIEKEVVHLIDAVTTNKTDFFREETHFDFMREVTLPDLVNQGHAQLRAWSSACSTGAEPYTMAMILSEFTEARPSVNYEVLATDLSTDVLQTARTGIYSEDFIAPVPAQLRQRYLMTSRVANRSDVRIVPRLRSKIGFGRMNLMDKKYPVYHPMHIIFCRNVLIYFDKPTQFDVIRRLCDCLVSGGYLFIGHSETISGLDLPLNQVSNTIFQRI